jgi:hypothetical protein
MTIHMSNWQQRKARKMSPQDTMLTDFLRATTPHEKRQVIKNFAPHYFIFGDKLDPRNPYEERSDEL